MVTNMFSVRKRSLVDLPSTHTHMHMSELLPRHSPFKIYAEISDKRICLFTKNIPGLKCSLGHHKPHLFLPKLKHFDLDQIKHLPIYY